MLSANAIGKIAGKLTLHDDGVFIVGGQALNLWAERYAPRDLRLVEFGPFTSKDIDYFGHKEAAMKLAEALDGTVKYPGLDDHTPEAAIVEAVIDGEAVSIDFITDVIGVKAAPLQKQAVVLVVPYRSGSGSGHIEIPIMHPLHCFQSRVANVVTLHRRHTLAQSQLNASPLILGHYIDDCLNDGEFREAQQILQNLHVFLTKHLAGKTAHKVCLHDPLNIFTQFVGDERLPLLFRRFNMTRMRLNIWSRRRPGDRAAFQAN